MLCELAQDKLVISQTGAMGGSRLARRPEEITLLDVYRAVESRGVFSLHRQHPSNRCPVGVNIETVLGTVLEEVDSAVEQVLAKITIRDVVGRLKPYVSKTDVHDLERKKLQLFITEKVKPKASRRGASAV
jgi:Rrf2 family protein